MKFVCCVSGVVSTVAGGGGAALPGYVTGYGTVALFRGPAGIAIDSSNNILISDTNNHLIRKVLSSGE